MAAATRPDARSPRFRRDPFVRDGVSDHGRATAPRLTVPHMLPSATLTASASAGLLLSRLNSPPHTIAVYASPWSLPSKTQHSLPGGRYPLPGPDFHRLDLASFLALWWSQFDGGMRVVRRSRRALSNTKLRHYGKSTGLRCFVRNDNFPRRPLRNLRVLCGEAFLFLF